LKNELPIKKICFMDARLSDARGCYVAAFGEGAGEHGHRRRSV
jgi:hypothetical protein